MAGLALAGAVALGAASPNVAGTSAMVSFAGGHTRIGSEGGPPAETPPFIVDVKPFLLAGC